jgi:CRISPR system Cascade subunit CasD
VAEHLILRLEAPLQAWGDVAMDPRRPTRPFPSRSGLAGLLANALGWRYRDADRTTALQDALRYAVREDRPPVLLRDYQTADLGAIGTRGWTRWGIEERGGANATGNQILEKFYLADGAFMVALALADGAVRLLDREPLTLDEVEAALRRPARPLFLGRKGCPPATPLLGRPGSPRVEEDTPADALLQVSLSAEDRRGWERRDGRRVRLWYDPADGVPSGSEGPGEVREVWDRRDFRSNRFGGARRVALVLLSCDRFPAAEAERSVA